MTTMSERLRSEGLEQGLQKGMDQGRRVGEVAVLKRQIQRKFGELPSWAETRIDEAELNQLDVWLDAIITADTLDFLKL